MPSIDTIILGLIGINILLSGILTAIYARSFKKINSKITLGFLVFAAVFLLQNLMSLYFYNSLLEQAIFGVTTFHLTVNILELIALLTLTWITYK